MTVKKTMIATVVVITFLLGLLGFVVDYESRGYGTLRDAQALIQRVEVEVLQLRRVEKDFLARKDEKYIEKFSATHAATEKTLSKLLNTLKALSMDEAVVSHVQTEIADYADRFRTIVDSQVKIGLSPDTGLNGQLRGAVHEVEAILKSYLDLELQNRMLMLRRAEKDFMLRRDLKYVVKFQNDLDSIENIVARSELPEIERQKVQKALDLYGEGFLALVEAEKAIGLTHRDGKLGELRQAVHEAEGELEAFAQSLNQDIAAASRLMKWTLYSVIFGIIFAVAAMLSWTGFRVSRRVRRAAYSMHQVAAGDGDLTRRLDEKGSDEFAELGRSFNLFATKIHDLLKRVAELTTTLSQTSSKVTDAAYSTNASMLQLRENVHTVVVATEEMSATAQEVAGSASRVSDSSQGADAISAEGKNTVEHSIEAINSFAVEFNDAAETIASLRGETENIGSILDVIRSISEQTNLLALNAAIEAARAGEQGRGFAVVADEVRTLAHRSHASTSEIQELIERLQSQAESAVVKIQSGHERITETVSQAGQAGAALERITDSVGSITDMTTQIATAAEEQSVVVGDISTSVAAIDSLALDTANSAQGTTALTADLERSMSAVTQELQQFRFGNDEQLVLAQARTAHINWKGKLRAFLDGDALLSSDQVLSHHHCDLGKWYDGEGRERFGDRAEFQAINDPHERIHKAIKHVVELREQGDRQGAEAAYANVECLSGEVVECLDRLAGSLQE